MKINLTRAELDAAVWAVGNFTESNARDIKEMMLCGMTRGMAKALLRADEKMRVAGRYVRHRKQGEI